MFFLIALLGPAAVIAAPQRVVSLGICGDRIALALLEPERIAALSGESQDARYSPGWRIAAGRPVHDGSTEGVLAHRPDLVLASDWHRGPAVAMLERLKVPIHRVGLPRSFDEIRAEVQSAAVALGAEGRGTTWLAGMERRLAELAKRRPPAAVRPLAAYLMPDGLSAGSATLVHAAMEVAGFENLTARLGHAGWGILPLEHVVAARPEVLVLSYFDDAPRLAVRLGRHPVLRAVPGIRDVAVPSRSWLCGDPHVVEAVDILAGAVPR